MKEPKQVRGVVPKWLRVEEDVLGNREWITPDGKMLAAERSSRVSEEPTIRFQGELVLTRDMAEELAHSLLDFVESGRLAKK